MKPPDEATVRVAFREIEALAIAVVSSIPEYDENGHRFNATEKIARLEAARERWVKWFTTGTNGPD